MKVGGGGGLFFSTDPKCLWVIQVKKEDNVKLLCTVLYCGIGHTCLPAHVGFPHFLQVALWHIVGTRGKIDPHTKKDIPPRIFPVCNQSQGYEIEF